MGSKNIRPIYCCNCEMEVNARFTGGGEIYPHRTDLHHLSFWKCDACNGNVGCHHKYRTEPLGVIPSTRISKIKVLIHHNLAVLWRNRQASRKAAYEAMSKHLGYDFHSAEIKSEEEANRCLEVSKKVKSELGF